MCYLKGLNDLISIPCLTYCMHRLYPHKLLSFRPTSLRLMYTQVLHYLVTGNVPFARMPPVTIAQLAAEQLMRPDLSLIHI